MSLISTTRSGARRIIIEGPDCVGKDTFIDAFKDYLSGVDRFDGSNMFDEPYVEVINNKTQERITDIRAHTIYDGIRNEVLQASDWTVEHLSRKVPRYGNVLSFRSIHSKDGSRESAEFLAKLDGGEITDQRAIAEEYLQVHYDLERHASELDTVLDLVIMNRSLISYHAMQIETLGFTDLKEKWEKLWNFAEQKHALYVRLTAPEAVVRERLERRQNLDHRGEVENFYMDRWKQIEQGFSDFQASGRCPLSMTVDTTNDPVPYFKALVHWVVMGQIADSIERGEGTAGPTAPADDLFQTRQMEPIDLPANLTYVKSVG